MGPMVGTPSWGFRLPPCRGSVPETLVFISAATGKGLPALKDEVLPSLSDPTPNPSRFMTGTVFECELLPWGPPRSAPGISSSFMFSFFCDLREADRHLRSRHTGSAGFYERGSGNRVRLQAKSGILTLRV